MIKLWKLFTALSLLCAGSAFSQESKIATFYGLPAGCGDLGDRVECTWPNVMDAGDLKRLAEAGESARFRFGSNASATSMIEYDINCGSSRLVRYQVSGGRIFDYYIPSGAAANLCGDRAVSITARWFGSASSLNSISDSEIIVTNVSGLQTASTPASDVITATCGNGLLLDTNSPVTIARQPAGPCRTNITKTWSQCRLVNGDLTVLPQSSSDTIESHGGRCGNLN